MPLMLKPIALLLLLACAAMPQEAERLSEEGPPWADLEQQLRAEGVETDTPSLIALADSNRDAQLRWLAIEILGLRKEPAAKEVLWHLLSGEEDRLLRETAALALARLGDERGLQGLRDLALTTPTTQRQLFLAARLAELGNPVSYPQVVEATKSEDAYERFLSVAALVPFVRLQASGKGPATGPDPIEELVRLAQDSDPKVRYEVLVQLPIAARGGELVQKLKPMVAKMAQEDTDNGVREKANLVLTLWGSSR